MPSVRAVSGITSRRSAPSRRPPPTPRASHASLVQRAAQAAQHHHKAALLVLTLVLVCGVAAVVLRGRSSSTSSRPMTFAQQYKASKPKLPAPTLRKSAAGSGAASAAGGGSTTGFGFGAIKRSFAERMLHLNSEHQELAEIMGSMPPVNQTLRFNVCNGFANQRLSVVYGVMLAVRLNRSVVMPELLTDGLQRTNADKVADGTNSVPFGDVYDEMHFRVALARAGIRVLTEAEAPPATTYATVKLGDLVAAEGITHKLQGNYSNAQHLALDCPLFKLQPAELTHLHDGPIIWTVLDAMRPAPEVRMLGGRACAALHTPCKHRSWQSECGGHVHMDERFVVPCP